MPDKETVSTPVAAPADVDSAITLEEFCTRRSKVDRRVELLGAFFSSERAAGRHKDEEQRFDERLTKFASEPA